MGRFQFSLRVMLVAIAVVSIPVAILIADSDRVRGGGIVLLSMLIPGVLVGGALNTQGLRRVFLVGALFPAIFSFVLCVYAVAPWVNNHNIQETAALDVAIRELAKERLSFGLLWGAMPVLGSLTVLITHILFPRRQDP